MAADIVKLAMLRNAIEVLAIAGSIASCQHMYEPVQAVQLTALQLSFFGISWHGLDPDQLCSNAVHPVHSVSTKVGSTAASSSSRTSRALHRLYSTLSQL